ncbi:TonB-dependent siderophore receptor [Psychrobium sp. 1_MG-2023]|uniref:TonB-dependent receptor plug domain-containing protein n=1 Tax=Psychrobium sp. 1_MG-2023 TaxID=3062624 RepID=UPI000C322B84|nr:TonB-dependent receptor [Psychrobium sp. 1_MG-2023]MDP2561708.1 TonB-dependent receptor [Psychrobium sp. 1_MG-2023]PKF57109.1 TonB-dependent receptor [Alteromonadales bacterium alter-6D02]
MFKANSESKFSKSYLSLCIAAVAVQGFTATSAIANEQTVDKNVEVITTIGSRVNGRTDTESAAPVDIISEETILNSGAVNTMDMLRKVAPSFNMNNTTTSDGQDLMRPATLRSLGADQVLVLINGKRRHQQALVAVQQNVGRGNAGTDLSAIPLSAISRVEILRDGAAAQYGSDAIAGVINIVLKSSEGGSVSTGFRTTSEGDGDTIDFAANVGVAIGESGNLNLTYEYKDADEMNRASKTTWFDAIDTPKQLLLVGEGTVESHSFWYNADVELGKGQLYSFGGFTTKEGESKGFFRSAGDDRVWPQIFPEGITPELGSKTEDTSIVVGYKQTLGEWDLDLSYSYGHNELAFENIASLNASYGPDSPTTAKSGSLEFNQSTINVDFTRFYETDVVENGIAVAVGAEWRQDGYVINAGDEVSYSRGDTDCSQNSTDGATKATDVGCIVTAPGMQGFAGYRPEMEIDTDRDSVAVYFDSELYFSDQLTVGTALRYEDYSDFGDTVIGKLTARYDVNDQLSFRGAVSTGFRAPGVQQKHFTQRSISISDGVLTDLVTLRPDSELAQELGFESLKEETSKNLSLGLVYQGDSYSTTLDFYQVSIDDRIVYSGDIKSGINSEIDDFFARHSTTGDAQLDGVAVVQIFTNAIDTQTRGVEWVNTWEHELEQAQLTFEASLSFNETETKGINTSSSIVPDSTIFDESQQLLIEEAQPNEKAVLGATYARDSYTVTGRVNYYGEVSTASYGTPKNTWGAKSTVDLTGFYELTDNFRISAGIVNLFDEKPDEWGENGGIFPALGFKYGWTSFPFSLAGREMYVKANYRF